MIKNLPEDLHARLREQAGRNRRSVTKEAVTMIARGVVSSRKAPELGPPFKLDGGPVTTEEIEAAINDGRG